MAEFQVTVSTGSYPVIIESGCVSQIPARLKQLGGYSKVLFITDAEVERLYYNEIENRFRDIPLDAEIYTIPPGEKSKSIQNYSLLIKYLAERNFTRNDLIIAFGGGVVNDLAGLVAATYMRGIRWISVPTTLLAQADACIGGKTSVHFAGVKNLIGAFHQPSLVFIDPEFLKTLSKRDYLCGLSEIMKMAVLPGNKNFSIWDNKVREKMLAKDENTIAGVIEESCRFKAKVIERDEFDRAGRIVLNLGHTLGHALEAALGFEHITHGEAVCIGTLFISWVSNNNHDMPDEDLEKIRNLFMPVANAIPADNVNCAIDLEWNILHDFICHDKKRSNDVRWVYPVAIGKIKLEELESDDLHDAWIEFIKVFAGWCESGRDK
ncbi:3-dehydroquinate synthase [bacterium]|nr:3-dehydroquinate synthase [bacterium]